MANQKEIEAHYDTLGPLHALRMEEEQNGFPDYTCAFYDGDYTKSYVQAQRDKHTWIFDGVRLGQDLTNKRILDIGCGWGPILNAARERGSKESVGLTLSSGQVAYCTARGLDARLKDYKTLVPGEFGTFDAVISVGALEHFCSITDMLAGKQNEVYQNFFKICAEQLPAGAGLFLQTMTWGKEVPDYKKLSLKAPTDSPEAILARMEYFYPESWLPNGLQQLVDCARPYFDFVSNNNGRRDYLQTLQAWNAATSNLWKLKNIRHTIRYFGPYMFKVLTQHDAAVQWDSFMRGDQRVAFEREIMSHERIFFVKK